MRHAQTDIGFFRDRAILTTRNDIVATINAHILERLPGQTRVYDAVDSVGFDTLAEGVERPDISQEFLRVQNLSGLINKAQGQSLKRVGIDLRQSVFTHGQFYVALSRVTDVGNLDILLPERGNGKVENIVYQEVLLK